MFQSTGESRKDLTIAIYRSGFGLVREVRDFSQYNLQETIQFTDIAETTEMESFMMKGLELEELAYDFDLADKMSLMEKYIGKTVLLHDRRVDFKKEYRLLSVKDGIILENKNTGSIIINPKEEIVLPALPGGVSTEPSLICQVKPEHVQEVVSTYLANGLSWKMNYVIKLHESIFDMTTWITFHNNTGNSFADARITMVAGDVHRRRVADVKENRNDEPVTAMKVDDYYMYPLERNISLEAGQEKQVAFMQKQQVEYEKYYEYRFKEKQATIMLKFENTEENMLGLAFPEGDVNVYEEDMENGQLEFIGEDRVDNLPAEETVYLNLGDALDLICTSRMVRSYQEAEVEHEEYMYHIKNNKKEDASMYILHPMREQGWVMVESTHMYEFEQDNEITFDFVVESGEEVTINFTYKWEGAGS